LRSCARAEKGAAWILFPARWTGLELELRNLIPQALGEFHLALRYDLTACGCVMRFMKYNAYLSGMS